MIEQLKDLTEGTLVAFDNEDVIEIADADELVVSEVRTCLTDDNEFVIVEMDDFCLVAHNFDTDPRYFFYQLLDSGTAEDLENDGYYFLTEEQDFRSKIVCRDDSRGHVYKHSEVGALYDVADGEECVSLCEYVSNTHDLTHMLVIKGEDDELLIYQGIEIAEDDFTVSEADEG